MSEETINSSWKLLYQEFDLNKESPVFVEQLKMIFYIGASAGAYIASKAYNADSKKQKALLLEELSEFIKTNSHTLN